MRKIALYFCNVLIFVLLIKQSVAQVDHSENIPPLDELAGDWMPSWQLEQSPAIGNFYGGLRAGYTVSSISSLTFPQFSQGPYNRYNQEDSLRYQKDIMQLYVDKKPALTKYSKWYPYQIKRKTREGDLEIETTVRAVFENEGVLWKIRFKNTAHHKTIRHHINFILRNSHIHQFAPGEWCWSTPRSTDNDYTIKVIQNTIIEKDNKSDAVAYYHFINQPDSITHQGDVTKVSYQLSLPAGEEKEVDILMAIDSSAKEASYKAEKWQHNFNEVFKEAKDLWQQRYYQAFEPGNHFFSGYLPTLVTKDSVLRRIYYESIVSWLELLRTNFKTGYKRVFITAGPDYANTLTYYWDMVSYSTLWALLDPAAMRRQLLFFLSQDIKQGYAVNFMMLTQCGPWYSFNDYALFHAAYTYLSVTGDTSFLDMPVGNTTVCKRLYALATSWKKLKKPGTWLADYGGIANNTETDPDYVHIVPALNAANVWMCRKMATILADKGEKDKAEELRKDADSIADAVLKLYVNNKGYWYSENEKGIKKAIPTCIDFFTIGECMTKDLTNKMKKEMMEFVMQDLWEGNWMRALALYDDAAQQTLSTAAGRASLHGSWQGMGLRPDHGVTGAYTAWPALTAETFLYFNKPRLFLHYLCLVAPVLKEGPFGQSDYVGTEITPVRKAGRGGQDYFEGAGGAFAEAIIRSLFGVSPDYGNNRLFMKNTSRGVKAKLLNVHINQKNINIVSKDNGLNKVWIQ